MKQKPLDSRREQMVAALYGELSPDQMQALEAACADDETLQRDWDELRGARAFLRRAGREEAEPDYTFVFPPGETATASRLGGILVRPWRWLVPAAAGFAAAAAVFVALLVAGLRVDRTPQGILVGFDQPPATQPPTDPLLTYPAATQGLATRAELANLAQMLVATTQITTTRLGELELRQAGEQAVLVRELYEALSRRQERHYDDLRTEIGLAPYRAAALLEPHLYPQPVPPPDPGTR